MELSIETIGQQLYTGADMEKQLRQNLKNEFFHHKKKKCNIGERLLLKKMPNGKIHKVIIGICYTHKLDMCKCGWQTGKHYGYLMTTKYKIKNKCASCLEKFENSRHYYKTHGNFCSNCLAIVNKKLKENTKKSKRGFVLAV